jgi:tetratricopeptide (TPR) repeat protein
LAIYEKLHDSISAASLHQAIGMGLLFSGKYKPAIAEFSASLEELKGTTRAPEPLIAGYLLRGDAENRVGDAAQALADSASARAAAAEFRLPANSFEMIAAALVEGAALTRLGRGDEADAAIRQAVRMAATRSELPQMISTRMRMGILREYSIALQAAHRKPEAKRVAAQALKLQSTLPGTCVGCTISVAALTGTALNLPGLP